MIGPPLLPRERPRQMPELLRCPTCHRWSDALLVWAAGDCCPTCNAEMGATREEHVIEHSARMRLPAGLTRAEEHRLRPRGRVSEFR
jgi:hypothetical protein